MKVPVVHCHPDHESSNAAFFREDCDLLHVAGNNSATLNLHAKQFDTVMTLEKRKANVSNPGPVESRVQKHVVALRMAEHLVFIHAAWSYGSPGMQMHKMDDLYFRNREHFFARVSCVLR